MSELIVTRHEDGQLGGLDDRGVRAYQRFLRAMDELAIGETMKLAYWLPRSPGYHRRHFKILAEVYRQQEAFTDPEEMRKWLEVGAGFCTFAPHPTVGLMAIPKSIAWEKLEQADFEAHHAKVMAFLRSVRCTRYLWPRMSDLQADEFINNVLARFGE